MLPPTSWRPRIALVSDIMGTILSRLTSFVHENRERIFAVGLQQIITNSRSALVEPTSAEPPSVTDRIAYVDSTSLFVDSKCENNSAPRLEPSLE